VQEESASERVTRVLFAHLNSLLFAHSQFVKTGRTIGGFNVRNALRGAIAKMMGRFGRFGTDSMIALLTRNSQME